MIRLVLERLGIVWQHDPRRTGAILFSVKRLDDVCCAIELDGHTVDCKMPGGPDDPS